MKTLHQKIYLIRHGETEWSKSGKHTGLTDIPLTSEGTEQAAWLKPHLDKQQFKKVLCSPLARAKTTCEIAGLFDKAEIDENLVEWNYGDYEGLTSKEIHQTDPKWNIFDCGAPGGESVGEIASRAQKVIAKCQGIAGDVALFSSGHFSRALAAKWLHLPIKEGKLFLLSTASVSILSYEHNTPAIALWNQTGKG